MKSLILTAAMLLLTSGIAIAETLTVEVTNIRNGNGTVRMALFNQAAGFPEEQYAIAVQLVRTSGNSGVAVFSGLSAGLYGVAVFHDENGNETLDTNLIGLPVEGYGFSNNARGALGAPRFRAVAITINGTDINHSITMGY